MTTVSTRKKSFTYNKKVMLEDSYYEDEMSKKKKKL